METRFPILVYWPEQSVLGIGPVGAGLLKMRPAGVNIGSRRPHSALHGILVKKRILFFLPGPDGDLSFSF